jgi:hypothetical protein
MSTLYFRFKVDDVATDVTSVVLSDPAGAYGVKRNDTNAVVVADATALTKQSTGVYSYTFTDPAYGLTYTYYVEYVYDGETYYEPHTFTGPVASTGSASFNFGNLWQRIAAYIYGGTSWSAAQTTEAKQASNDGYLAYLNDNPAGWTFMAPSATLAVTAGSTTTALPTDFGELVGGFTLPTAATAYNTSIESRGEGFIRAYNASGITGGYPLYYAIVPSVFVAATGQRNAVLWGPPCGSSVNMNYRYRVYAAALVNDTDYPLGGQAHAMTILQSALRVAEQRKGDVEGVQSMLYFKMYLPQSITRDNALRPSNLGYNGDGPGYGGGRHSSMDRHSTFTYDGTSIL